MKYLTVDAINQHIREEERTILHGPFDQLKGLEAPRSAEYTEQATLVGGKTSAGHAEADLSLVGLGGNFDDRADDGTGADQTPAADKLEDMCRTLERQCSSLEERLRDTTQKLAALVAHYESHPEELSGQTVLDAPNPFWTAPVPDKSHRKGMSALDRLTWAALDEVWRAAPSWTDKDRGVESATFFHVLQAGLREEMGRIRRDKIRTDDEEIERLELIEIGRREMLEELTRQASERRSAQQSEVALARTVLDHEMYRLIEAQDAEGRLLARVEEMQGQPSALEVARAKFKARKEAK